MLSLLIKYSKMLVIINSFLCRTKYKFYSHYSPNLGGKLGSGGSSFLEPWHYNYVLWNFLQSGFPVTPQPRSIFSQPVFSDTGICVFSFLYGLRVRTLYRLPVNNNKLFTIRVIPPIREFMQTWLSYKYIHTRTYVYIHTKLDIQVLVW